MECYCCGKDVDELIDMGVHDVCGCCVNNGKDEDWVNIDLDMDDETLSKLAVVANQENLTINMVISRALRTFVEENKDLSKEELQEKFKVDGAVIKENDASS